MNSINNLSVDFQTRTITVSSKFLRLSRVYGSPEYETMLRLMQDLPGFSLETRHAAKPARRPYMPSYDEMTARIQTTSSDPAEALQEFERMREFARMTGEGYMMVRAWFLDRYELHPLLTAV